MKSLFTILLALLLTIGVNAQSPNIFNYQGVARDLSGNLIANKNVGLRISILKNSIAGSEVYKEIHLISTNNLGLFAIQIGSGTVISGSIGTIDWGNGTYYLKIEMDENGGSNYQLIGTNQLLSVPYALYAKTAGNSISLNAPSANVTTAINITFDSAVLNGVVNGNGFRTDVQFDWGTDTNFGFSVNADQTPVVGSNNVNVTTKLSKLQPNTTYYYRIKATNAVNTTLSTNLSFKTNSLTPILTTAAVSQITSNSATSGGTITSDGGSPIIARGVCWKAGQNPTINDSKTTDGSGIGTFTSTINGLNPNTDYTVRAYATTNKETYYGENISFNTPSPSLQTNIPSNITSNSAVLGGNIDGLNNGGAYECGIVYAAAPNPTIANNKVVIGSFPGGNFSKTVDGLTPNTTYYFRAYYSFNSQLINYGDEKSFKTLLNVSTPTYVPTTNLIAWWPFNGNANDEGGSGLNGQVNGAILTTDRFGNSKSAYSFTTDQDITIPNSADKNLYPLTISLWYNVSSIAVQETGNLFSKYVSAAWNGFMVHTIGGTTDGNIMYPWYIRSSTNKVLGLYGEEAFHQPNYEINKWYHFVYTVDNSGGKIFVNGVLIGTHSWTGEAGPSSNSFLWKIGGFYNHWFHGIIDDIGIWNRALSQQEITGLYNSGQSQVKSVPTVTTNSSSNVTNNSAVLGGNVTSDGNATVTERGVVYGLSQSPTITDTKVGIGSGVGIFSQTISGLTANTTYFARAYAINSMGISYGQQISFTTLSSSTFATLTTNDALILTTSSVTLGGNITSEGGSSVTERGVVYGTSSSPTISSSKKAIGSGTGSFSATINGLSANTTYYARAYAINASGVSYGNEVNFTLYLNVSGASVTDIDGNTYKTVKIGTQTWMVENLKTTKYRNGESIPNVTDQNQWAYLKTGAYCDFNNVANNSITYGHLYNWYTITDTRNIAPSGWHVATDQEWQKLSDYLGGDAVSGGKLKEAGTINWNSPNAGADNSSGFTALPGGFRDTYNFYDLGRYGLWWTAPLQNSYSYWRRNIDYSVSNLGRNTATEIVGFSVKCIKD